MSATKGGESVGQMLTLTDEWERGRAFTLIKMTRREEDSWSNAEVGRQSEEGGLANADIG